ncbi:MAG: hypothetical protein J5I93_22965 [Pirellulaceae bacterium]|nr:hypothetical protein [Pirellulaceae bacterium]
MNTKRLSLPLAWIAMVLGLAGVPTASGWQAPSNDSAAEQPPAAREPIDFNRARQLLLKRRGGQALTAEEEAYLERARAERRRQQPAASAPEVRDKTGLVPLTDMTADDRYQGEPGGLYGNGRDTPDDALRSVAERELARIQPLDAEGNPSDSGRVVLVSISMSNATQEFSTFVRLAEADPVRSTHLKIVDCAQGGQAMAEWAPPDAPPWRIAEQRLAAAGVSTRQVQVAWIKLANKGPSGDLREHGRKLQRDTQAVLQNAKARFPNLRVAYLSSRIYGGYANNRLNPEPYAYESAFAVRWLIQEQQQGSAALNFDPQRGPVKAPLILWGPYLWADGVTPRGGDQLVWLRGDLAGDGTHPSPTGRQKVAGLLLKFFQHDPLAQSWYLGPAAADPAEAAPKRS